MLKIRVVSDLHCEFYLTANASKRQRILEKYLPVMEGEKDMILCVAGDTGLLKDYPILKSILKMLADRFKYVLLVYGNHEYYSSVGIWGKEKEYWAGKNLPGNVHILHNSFVIIDSVVFIGSPLWTDFNNSDPLAMWHAERNMNDFRCIRTAYAPQDSPYGSPRALLLSPLQTVEAHREAVQFIREALELFKKNRRVVITHHAPSSQSVSPQYAGDILNYAFYTDLSKLILYSEPNLWLHGHMHDNKDYMLGNTRVLCNPAGYHMQQINPRFDGKLVVEV